MRACLSPVAIQETLYGLTTPTKNVLTLRLVFRGVTCASPALALTAKKHFRSQFAANTNRRPSGFRLFAAWDWILIAARQRKNECRAVISRPSRKIRVLCAAIAASWLCSVVWSQPAKPTEYEVKAAYLYNFGRFVRWPEAAGPAAPADFLICILGTDPFGASLENTIAQQMIGDKRIIGKRIASVRETSGCRILFISTSEAENIANILVALQGIPTLTVSDMPGFDAKGGMIQFLVEKNRVTFEVNLLAAEKAGLSLSSQLLKLAKGVQGRSAKRE